METEKTIIKPVVKDGKVIDGYYIDNFGTVYSTKKGILSILSKQYRPATSTSPYPNVRLCNKGKTLTCLVHRLVCEAFVEIPLPEELRDINWNRIPEPERTTIKNFATHSERYQVNHIDHDPNNYKANNLEWVTPKENQRKYQERKKSTL